MVDIDIVRKIIAEKSTDFVINGTQDALVIRTFTGSGKTTTVLNAIDSLGLRWIYVAPTHDIIKQNVKQGPLRQFNFLHLEGRERCCLRAELKELIPKGINISGFCDECSLRETECDYYMNQHRAFTETPNICVTHAHINTWLPMFLNTHYGDITISDNYDVLIVDENPITCFLHEEVTSRRELSYIRDVMTLLGMPGQLIRLIDLLMFTRLNYNELRQINLHGIDPLRLNKTYSMRLANRYMQGEIDQIPKNIIPILFKIYENFELGDPIEQMIFYRDRMLNLCYFSPEALDFDLKIIGLDGTANQGVWAAMIGHSNFKLLEADYKYKNAYQLVGGSYPISTWKKAKDSMIKRICPIIDGIAATKKRSVLVCGTKFVNNVISKNTTQPNIEFATYYNLRSHNEFYKKCDTVILACEPNIPPDNLVAWEILSGWSKDILISIFREEEMLQALGRLRQNIESIDGVKRERMEVYILPSTGKKEFMTKDMYSDKMEHILLDSVEYTSSLLPEAHMINLEQLRKSIKGIERLDETTDVIIDILKSIPNTPTQYSKYTGMMYSKVRRYFNYMRKMNLIKKVGRIYDITENGKQKLVAEET